MFSKWSCYCARLQIPRQLSTLKRTPHKRYNSRWYHILLINSSQLHITFRACTLNEFHFDTWRFFGYKYHTNFGLHSIGGTEGRGPLSTPLSHNCYCFSFLICTINCYFVKQIECKGEEMVFYMEMYSTNRSTFCSSEHRRHHLSYHPILFHTVILHFFPHSGETFFYTSYYVTLKNIRCVLWNVILQHI